MVSRIGGWPDFDPADVSMVRVGTRPPLDNRFGCRIVTIAYPALAQRATARQVQAYQITLKGVAPRHRGHRSDERINRRRATT